MNKLRFDGYWANRPRDIANLARYASYTLERPINFQVVSMDHDWPDWTDFADPLPGQPSGDQTQR